MFDTNLTWPNASQEIEQRLNCRLEETGRMVEKLCEKII
jgi:hypothetical protein